MSPVEEALSDVRAWQQRKHEQSPEFAWDMALHSLMTATQAVHEMAQSETYRDFAVSDLDKITEATLAINLTHSQLTKRKVA